MPCMEGVDMKNARKLTALFVALIMILGMIPMASAELTNCSHDWDGGKWLNGAPANCQDWKIKRYTCTICGATRDWDECGSCVAGSKQWIRPQGSNCQEYGVWEITCKYCGEWLSGGEEPGPHKWATYTHEQPTCEYPGSEETLCSVCGDEKGDWHEIPALGHNWGEWQWAHEQPSCNTGAWQVRECKRCGRMEDRWVEAGYHRWGEWMVLIEPTCTETGTEHRQCRVCGDFWARDLEALGHEMGEWTIVKQPAAGENGLKERKCVRCEYTEQEEIPYTGGEIEYAFASLSKREASSPANGEFYILGETVLYSVVFTVPEGLTLFDVEITDPIKGNNEDAVLDIIPEADGGEYTYSVSHTVTETDIENGFVSNIAAAYFFDPEGDAWVSVSSNEVTVLTGGDDNSAVILEKIDMRGPANGEYYVPGEAIKYGLTVRSDENNPLGNIVIYDPLKGGDQIVFGPADAWVLGAEFDYTVTEADAQRGYIENTGYATFTYQNTGKEDTVYSNTLILPCGVGDPGDLGLVDGLTVIKKVTSTPANGSYYVPGEIIFFAITVANSSDETLINLTFHDPLISDAPGATVPNFVPGAVVNFQAFWLVTDVDAFASGVTNIAYVTATDKDGNQVTEYSNLVTVPCGFDFLDVTITPEDPFGIFHSLTLVKKEESLPLNGEYYTEGEVIHYSITYVNDGELPLTDVEVWDNMDINTVIAHAETLNPGESRTCYYQHTVTSEDVNAGGVLNLAQANYAVSGAEGTVGVNSNLVFSKTSFDGMHCVVLPPLFPDDGEDPEYDPGIGWFPSDDPIIEGDTPPFGTIDTDALHGGDGYCVRTITGRDNVSASYETTFCSVHSPIQSAALMMAQYAVTPETQIQVAAYNVILWRTEVQKLYEEIFAFSDPAAKMVVTAEYSRFLTEIANYEAMLKLMYPDQPALVAQKVAAMWENKCIVLCYDMHATATERKDSLLAVTPTTGAAAESCSCEVTAQANGTKTETQGYCSVHSFPFSMIDALLQGNDTVESWTMVRQIWGVELTSAYNKVYTAMGDNKLLAMAEYNAFTQWMMAREAFLIALYPDNPEVVAQIMVKTIMDRVIELCE